MFEPTNSGVGTSDEWEDIEENGAPDVEEILESSSREKMEVDQWCKCDNCVKMNVSRECICCEEIEEVRHSKESMSKPISYTGHYFS